MICFLATVFLGVGEAENVLLVEVGDGLVVNVGELEMKEEADFFLPVEDLPVGDVGRDIVAIEDAASRSIPSSTLRLLLVHRVRLESCCC